jgi:predicted AAA+ superfamily ATPase
MDDLETKKREVNGLVATCLAYGLKKGYIVTMDEDDKFSEQGVKVIVVPAWKFLLER